MLDFFGGRVYFWPVTEPEERSQEGVLGLGPTPDPYAAIARFVPLSPSSLLRFPSPMRFFADAFGQPAAATAHFGVGEHAIYEWEITRIPADQPWDVEATVEPELLTPARARLGGRDESKGVMRFQATRSSSGVVPFAGRSVGLIEAHLLLEVTGEAR